MYLSRLMLNPHSRQVQGEITNPYEMHRTIQRGFDHKRDKSGVLYRLEIDPRTGAITLLIQSQSQPDWGWLLQRDYLLPADRHGGLENPAIKMFDLCFRSDQVLRFRLRANPTIKKVRRDETGERRNGGRVPLMRMDQQLTWMARRGQVDGFRLVQVDIGQPRRLTGHKDGGGRQITVYTVQFDGWLRVIDPVCLREAVIKGVGSAKAFGCGLLSLARA